MFFSVLSVKEHTRGGGGGGAGSIYASFVVLLHLLSSAVHLIFVNCTKRVGRFSPPEA